MKDDLEPEEAVARVAQHLGQEVRLIARYELGDEGAYHVAVDDTPAVLKYWSGERAAGLRLAEAVAAHGVLQRYGWPLPAIRFWHCDPSFACVIETQMPGHRVDAVPAPLCHALLALLAALPAGVGYSIGTSQAWLLALEQSLHHDLPLSPCRPLALQRTAIGRRLITLARDTFAVARPNLAAARDIIHGDFSAGNVLCGDAGRLVALLDWQRACVGHRGFDLIGLEWDLALRLNVGSAPSLAQVTALVNEQVEEPVRTFCRAYYAVWNLSWAFDTEDEDEVLRAVAMVAPT